MASERIDNIEEFGKTLFTYKEVELVMGEPGLAAVLAEPSTPEHAAYEKGRLMSIYLLRQSTLKMAQNGSAPAQAALEKIIKDNEYKNIAEANGSF